MKKTRLSNFLEIEHPVLQAGLPWVSNPELVAAVSEAGGLGSLHPTAGMAADGDVVENLRENVRQTRRLTDRPFSVSLNLANPAIQDLLAAVVEEGVRVVITYGGSPALHTGYLQGNDVKVLHQVATVRHARSAEAHGVDAIIAEGVEGGGFRGPDELTTLVLVPQVVDAVTVPVVASGGVSDARGFAAALALGAEGVQIGTRFVATHECIAHQRYKEAVLSAIDTGTILAGRYHLPTRLLRTDVALRLKDEVPPAKSDRAAYWEERFGIASVRAAFLEGDLDNAVAYCAATVGLVSEITSAAEVVQSLVEGAEAILRKGS
ncbi:MAG: NAD(P)H-dependent flavin oxidoreductase [Dehalococcoidia bacterium]